MMPVFARGVGYMTWRRREQSAAPGAA